MEVTQLIGKVSLEGVDKAKSDIAGLHNEVGKSPGLFRAASGGMNGFLKTALGVAGGVLGFMAVKDAIMSCVDAAGESQQVMAQTVAGIKSTGGVAGMTAQAVADLADHISQLSGIDDEAVQTGENMLLTFTNVGKSVFPQATQAIADMATKMNGGAIPSAQQMQQQALLVGKALNDPIKGITALTRVGVTFSDQQKTQIAQMMKAGDVAGAQKVILGELQKEFGGAAEAAGDTFPGKMAKFQVALGNMQETIGGAIIPILSDLMSGFQPVMQAIAAGLPGALDALKSAFAPVFSAIGDAVKQLGPVIGQVVSTLTSGGGAAGATGPFAAIKDVLTTLLPVVMDVGRSLIANLLPIFQSLGPVISQVASVFKGSILPVLQTLWANIQANVLPALRNIITAILGNLVPAVLRLVQAIAPVLMPVLNVLGFILGNIVGPALVLVVNVLGFLINVVATVVGWVVNLVMHIGDLGTMFQQLVVWGATLHAQLMAKIGALVLGIIGFFQQLPGRVIGLVVGLVTGVLGWIGNLERQAIAKVIELATGFIQQFQQLPGRLVAIGGDIIHGLLEGLKGAAGAVISWITGLAGNIISSVKGVFGIHSPSTVFMDIGYNLAASTDEGFNRYGLPGSIERRMLGVRHAAQRGAGGGGGGSGSAAHHAAAHHAAKHKHKGAGGGGGGSSSDLVAMRDLDAGEESVIRAMNEVAIQAAMSEAAKHRNLHGRALASYLLYAAQQAAGKEAERTGEDRSVAEAIAKKDALALAAAIGKGGKVTADEMRKAVAAGAKEGMLAAAKAAPPTGGNGTGAGGLGSGSGGHTFNIQVTGQEDLASQIAAEIAWQMSIRG